MWILLSKMLWRTNDSIMQKPQEVSIERKMSALDGIKTAKWRQRRWNPWSLRNSTDHMVSRNFSCNHQIFVLIFTQKHHQFFATRLLWSSRQHLYNTRPWYFPWFSNYPQASALGRSSNQGKSSYECTIL